MRKTKIPLPTLIGERDKDRGFDLSKLRFPTFEHNLKFGSHTHGTRADGRGHLETITAVLNEKRLRLGHLERWANMVELDGTAATIQASACFTPENANDLLMRLCSMKGVEKSGTFACPIFGRAYRIRFYGAASRLSQESKPTELQLFTLVPQLRGWRVRGADLGTVNPRLLLERLRQQLAREGVGEAGDWLIVSLHGDYDPTKDIYQFHLHGLAARGGIDLVRGLKRLPCYRRCEIDGAVYMPHRMYDWNGGARQGSYHLVQLIWPSRATFVDGGGHERRSRDRRRIPAPRYAEFLMWLDRLSFRDLVLLYGCRVSGGSLKTTKVDGC